MNIRPSMTAREITARYRAGIDIPRAAEITIHAQTRGLQLVAWGAGCRAEAEYLGPPYRHVPVRACAAQHFACSEDDPLLWVCQTLGANEATALRIWIARYPDPEHYGQEYALT